MGFRFLIGLGIAGLGLIAVGVGECNMSSRAKAEPQTLTMAELLKNGPGKNAHVELTDFALGDKGYLVQETGRFGSSNYHAWVPVTPVEELEAARDSWMGDPKVQERMKGAVKEPEEPSKPKVAKKGKKSKKSGKSSKKKTSSAKAKKAAAEKAAAEKAAAEKAAMEQVAKIQEILDEFSYEPGIFRAIVHSSNMKAEDEAQAIYERETLRGIVVRGSGDISGEEKKMLAKEFPGVNFGTLWVLRLDHKPAGAGKLFLYFGGGIGLIGAALWMGLKRGGESA